MAFALAAKMSLAARPAARTQARSVSGTRLVLSRPVQLQRAARLVTKALAKPEVIVTVAGKLKELIPDLASMDLDENTKFETLNIDSLDFVEVFLELEGAYDVKLSDAKFDALVTIGDAADLIICLKEGREWVPPVKVEA